MSKMVVVAVFDRAVGCFARPAFVQSKGAAIRSFQDEVRRQHADNAVANHPEDFSLYELGLYDEKSGTFTCGDPLLIVHAADLVEKSVEPELSGIPAVLRKNRAQA